MSASILIVSYYFPPQAAVGGRRPMRMARELAARGWRVDVLTTREGVNLPHDASLLPDARGLALLRTMSLEPRLLARWLRSRAAASASAPAAEMQAEPVQRSGARRVLRRALHLALEIPDAMAPWLPFALGVGLMRRPRPDLVLATSPPHTSLALGALLAAAFRVPLVADYRDAWTTLRASRGLPRWRERLDRRLERACLGRAALVLTTTPEMARGLATLTSSAPICVPNGYDAAEFARVPPHRFARPALVYAGNFYGTRSALPLLRALRRMRDDGKAPPGGFACHVLGMTTEETRRTALELGLGDCVVSEGFLPMSEAIARMKGAHGLLLLVGSDHGEMIPAKLYEYLAAERPILAFAPPGSAVAAELASLGVGCVVDSDDEARGAAALSDLLAREPERVPLPDGARRYEASALGDELDRRLRTLLPHSNGARA